MSRAQRALTPIPEAVRENFHWLAAPHLKSITDALEAAQKDAARFVGGCVRDSLIGQTPKDFDIATVLQPSEVKTAMEAANIRVVDTGIDHGTVTAISDHQGVEITTLRADVSTDGRRATVAFTTDWTTDACRRDFRLNAIYLTPGGMLFDPAGGVEDAFARTVRFIGDPHQRLREDYLRILRFFRFSARFCDRFDPEGLAACEAERDGLGQLSAERIGAEIMAILALPRAAAAIEAMAQSGVLGAVWAAEPDLKTLRALKEIDPDAAAPVALAAVFGAAGDGLGARLRLSNAEDALRLNALAAAQKVSPDLDDGAIRALIYRLGADVFLDGVLLQSATGALTPDKAREYREIADTWAPPRFGVSGGQLVKAGVAPGPDISVLLRRIEEQWISEGFPPPSRLEEILSTCVAAYGRR
ncbi:MAG: CCA tRNA nucleotidyltransferase [Pseudomonadota bacterium]